MQYNEMEQNRVMQDEQPWQVEQSGNEKQIIFCLNFDISYILYNIIIYIVFYIAYFIV